MHRIEQKLLLHHGITSGGSAAPNVNAPGSEAALPVKPTGKGEAAGQDASPETRGPANGAGAANPNAKRGNVRPS
jgi:hypothetical protein